MPVHNSDISQVFSELADLLEIEGANPFRVRAYRNAARVVGGWPQSLSEILAQGNALPKLPGLGADLSGKVKEIVSTGRLSALEETGKRVPRDLGTLLKIPGLGPKRVLALRNRFGISGLDGLKEVALRGEVRKLPGFGDRTEQRILEEIRRLQSTPRRFRLAAAEQIARPLLEALQAVPGVRQAVVAGSFRRRQETVGDLDLLITCRDPSRVMDRFMKYEEVEEVLARGVTKSTVRLRSGIQVDLRVVPGESYGAALHYFTGSKAHNIAVRLMGVRRGLKINEYGVFRGGRRIAGISEQEVYAQVDLPYIEPELREMRGEIDAALQRKLPKLVTLEDIRGDLHAHTVATDGSMSLMELAGRAKAKGYDYLAVTDHSRHLTVAHGLTPQRLRRQMAEIDRLNAKLKGFRLLKSMEVDILEDGRLDLPDEVLEELDLTVCSVHFKFNLSRQKQTERIIRAMDHRCFNILGHPTGRLIDERPAYEVDLERIMKAARERGCFLEINAQPDRLDLNDVHARLAKDLGVKVAVSTDAHGPNDLDSMRYGVYQARRGWLEAAEVLNTRSLGSLLRLLRRR